VPGPIVIFAALAYEANVLSRAVRGVPGVEVRVIGPRAVRLPAAADLAGARLVIMAGLAGALDPALLVGDVVIDGEVASVPSARRGTIHTATDIVATPEQKAALFASTGARAVDMENAAARALAAQAGVPFVGIRAISDRADEPLDPAVLRLVDSAGRLRPMRLTAELCRRPAFLGTLLRLRPKSALAMKNLATAVREIVSSPETLSFSPAPGTTTP
jgi:hypothetical protein